MVSTVDHADKFQVNDLHFEGHHPAFVSVRTGSDPYPDWYLGRYLTYLLINQQLPAQHRRMHVADSWAPAFCKIGNAISSSVLGWSMVYHFF